MTIISKPELRSLRAFGEEIPLQSSPFKREIPKEISNFSSPLEYSYFFVKTRRVCGNLCFFDEKSRCEEI